MPSPTKTVEVAVVAAVTTARRVGVNPRPRPRLVLKAARMGLICMIPMSKRELLRQQFNASQGPLRRGEGRCVQCYGRLPLALVLLPQRVPRTTTKVVVAVVVVAAASVVVDLLLLND